MYYQNLKINRNIKISLVVPLFFQNNRIFDEKNFTINRDDCQRQFIELKKNLLQDNIEINTVDITEIKNSDIAIFMNIPNINDEYLKDVIKYKIKSYAIINELDVIHEENKLSEHHKYFCKIFTYQQDLIDNIKYFKTNYSFDFIDKVSKFNITAFKEKKLITLIANNKTIDSPLELYSERVKAIRWFERNQPNHFDLYGNGWNVYKGRLHYFLTKKMFPSCRGKIDNKVKILNKYKFCICYENAHSIPGWITEKIFDSFFAGTVPIYFGCKNITDYVDKNCFINFTDFDSYSDLFHHINTISEIEYESYIYNIYQFLIRSKNDIEYEFGIPYFIKTIKNQILEDLEL